MTALSDAMKAVAASLLTEFGESASFTRVEEGAYNTATGTPAAGTTINYTANVVPFLDTNSNKAPTALVGNAGQLIFHHDTIAPLVGDTVVYNTINYRIVSVDATRLSGADIIHTLDISR